jgi:hypothetical protein
MDLEDLAKANLSEIVHENLLTNPMKEPEEDVQQSGQMVEAGHIVLPCFLLSLEEFMKMPSGQIFVYLIVGTNPPAAGVCPSAAVFVANVTSSIAAGHSDEAMAWDTRNQLAQLTIQRGSGNGGANEKSGGCCWSILWRKYVWNILLCISLISGLRGFFYKN